MYPAAALGFRSWRLSDDGSLRSIGLGRARWSEQAPMRARCTRRRPCRGLCPSERCHCGLYAYHDLNDAFCDKAYQIDMIAGMIAGSGRVLIHAAGWRAEEAQILALYCGPATSPIRRERAEIAAHCYGVPLLSTASQLAALAERLGVLSIPEEERPESLEAALAERRLKISSVL